MALYTRIADTIEGRIRSGRYRPGEKIPSVRQTASEFGCNKLTVLKAFDRLKRDGFLENIIGSGSFVRFPEKIARGGHVFDFRTAYISESFFPYLKAKKIFSDLFDTEKTGAFSSTPVEGDPELIRVLGETFRVPTERMLVISGAQQGLDLTAKVFAAPISDSILFEDPTYPGAISLFKAKHFIPLDEDGPDLDRLDRMLPGQIRLLYTMPTVHNPTGISYSMEKKRALGERAETYSLYIIEDDYLSEFQERSVPRFVDIFPERTIYIKSFSQTTVSGIRLGFMIVPEPLYEKFIYSKYTSDIFSAGLIQKFVMGFIRCGAYAKYVDRTRNRIVKRKKRLVDLIARYPRLTVSGLQSGYSLWVKADRPIELPQVPWTRGEVFSFSPDARSCFRISFMNMDDATFRKGIGFLKEIFDRAAV
jgi:2-aminoadipate transaminase